MNEQKPIARTEIYGALAGVNTSLHNVVEALKVLLDEDVITQEFFEDACGKIETIRFEISTTVLAKMSAVEAAELERLRVLRNSIEPQLLFHRNGHSNN